IAASSFRRPSERDPLELQQPALVLQPERAVRADPAGRDDAVTRHHDREPVPRAESPGRALRVGMTGERRQLPVRDRLAARYPAQHLRHASLERGRVLHVELDVEEVVPLAGEPADKAAGELVTSTTTIRRGTRELVQQEPITVEPQIPHSPPLDLVADVHVRNRRIQAMSAPGIFRPPKPVNEPVKDYAPVSPEREELRRRLDQ